MRTDAFFKFILINVCILFNLAVNLNPNSKKPQIIETSKNDKLSGMKSFEIFNFQSHKQKNIDPSKHGEGIHAELCWNIYSLKRMKKNHGL